MCFIFLRFLSWVLLFWQLPGTAMAFTPISLSQGWNLVANSDTIAIIPALSLSDSTRITSVWKWNKLANKWAFYTPTMTSAALDTYAQSKGYDVLGSIDTKQGFWVNAAIATTLTEPFAPPPATDNPVVSLIASDLQQGWNLVGSADQLLPSQLNANLIYNLNSANKSITTLWTWDAPSARWRFYSPALAAQGATYLSDYITNKGYLPFNAPLAPTEGFWVNMGVGGGQIFESIRPLPADFSSRKAVSYGPYRTATGVGNPFKLDSNGLAMLDANGACIPNPTDLANEEMTDANVLQDMKLLASAGFGLVRIFDSTTKVAERTLRVISANNLDIKVMLGARVHSYATSTVDQVCKIPSADVDNDNELARTVTLANQYKNIVSAVSIGNETMVSWAFSPLAPAKVAGYITRVKGQISQPVTSDDNWAFYADSTGINDPILQVVDFVSIHTYPLIDTIYSPYLWDWKQKSVLPSARAQAMINAAIASATKEYTDVRTHLDSKNLASMPIVIGETGWKAENTGNLAFRAHPVNQKMYLDKLAAWANEGRTGSGPQAIFYFEAFDEPWKAADDKWGLFNVNRQARYAIQGLQPLGATWVNEAGTYTDAAAVYWFAPSVGAAIDTTQYSRYTLYADAATPGELVAANGTNPPTWNTWENTVSGTANVTGSGTADGPYAYELRPTPTTWGWGISLGTDAKFASNLSQFASAGHLQFDIKTNAYPGKIEVGFQLNTPENEMVDAYLQLSSGSYGYVNDGAWHHVSIPITHLVNIAKANLTAGNSVDLSMVISPFVIADRYGHTGLPNVYVDKIFVSSN